jgi:hypothetical protein
MDIGPWVERYGRAWREKDDGLTLPGCVVLRFAEGGLCEDLREYWNVGFGPPVRPPGAAPRCGPRKAGARRPAAAPCHGRGS